MRSRKEIIFETVHSISQIALSFLFCRVDYARGGFEMVSTNDMNGHRTASLIKRYTYYLSSLPFISTAMGVTSSMFAIEGILLNGYAIYVAKNFERERSNGNARKVFLTSLWYLPSWMVLFLLHSKKWKEGVEEGDEENEMMEVELIPYLKRRAADIRDWGREKCIHELIGRSNSDGHLEQSSGSQKNKCPITLGKEKAKEAVEITRTSKIDSVQSQISK